MNLEFGEVGDGDYAMQEQRRTMDCLTATTEGDSIESSGCEHERSRVSSRDLKRDKRDLKRDKRDLKRDKRDLARIM